MQDYNIFLTLEAIHDVADITDYIETRFGYTCADQFQNKFQKEISQLGYMGGMFSNTQILYHEYTIYKKPFPPSIIFYIIKKPRKEIHILRVLRNECNWKRLLNRNHLYTYYPY